MVKSAYRKLFLSGLILCILAATFLSIAEEPEDEELQKKLAQLEPFEPEQRYVVAVLPFEYKEQNEEFTSSVEQIPDLLITGLFKTKRFRVVERQRINAVLDEIQLGKTEIIDSEKAVQVGKQTGAEMVLLGAVTSIKTTESSKSLGIIAKKSLSVEVSLACRLVDIKSGEVTAIAEASAREFQEKKRAFIAKKGDIQPVAALVSTVIERAVRRMVYELAVDSPVKPGNDMAGTGE